MKLSDAIRLGAMLKPQSFRSMLDSEGKTCALGAAADALGVLGSKFDFTDIDRVIDAMKTCWPLVLTISDGIIRRNDQEHWTRERIADWVETIEASEAGAQPEPVKVLAHVQG